VVRPTSTRVGLSQVSRLLAGGLGCVVLVLAACSGSRRPPPPPSAAVTPMLVPCPSSPNCVSSRAADNAHFVAPLAVSGDPGDVLRRLRRVIEGMSGGRVVTTSDTAVHAEFTSRLFRFVDDLDLELDERTRVVHVRSSSRVGYWDWGVNRRRVEAIRRALATESPNATAH